MDTCEHLPTQKIVLPRAVTTMEPVSNNSIWEAIQQLKAEMVSHLSAKIDPIQETLQTIQTSLSTLGDHVSTLEQRVSTNEDDLVDLKKRIESLEKDNTYLRDKVEDAENRSRAHNLRFLHVPEKAEGSDIRGFMTELIKQLLGADNFTTPPAIEIAHRSPTQLTTPTNQNKTGEQRRVTPDNKKPGPPRPIFVKFLSLCDRQHILNLSKEKQELYYEGHRVYIYPDYSAATTNKRRKFDAVKKRLRDLNMDYSLFFPATLSITVDGGKTRKFHCAKEAESFVDTLPRPME